MRVKYRCISAFHALQLYLVITLAYHFYSCTCWVPTISVLNLANFPCYSDPCSEDDGELEFFDEEF
jgi:hypothetical protein